MINRFVTTLSIIIVSTFLGTSLAQTVLSAEFDRVPIDFKMPTGQSVAIECQDEDADYPYTPYDWPDAKATLSIEQSGAQSTVTIDMTGVKPNMYYTMWLRLMQTDNEGNAVGANPLIGIPGTPLIPSTELDEALTFTGKGNAKVGLSNGVWSDDNGNAIWTSTVDFPIIGGAYPFHNFEGFDPTDERLTSPFKEDAPMAVPVAIANSGAPFTLRVASHCQSNVNYGLFPGPHEGWFDWLADSNDMAQGNMAQEAMAEAGENESVALAFLEARGKWDADALVLTLSDDLESYDIAATPEDYGDALAYYETVNWNWTAESCQEDSLDETQVSRNATLENDWTRALDIGPFDMMFNFVVEDGKITTIDPQWNPQFIEQGLQRFLGFLRDDHPDDFDLLYGSGQHFLPRGEEALSVLEARTAEFASSVE